MSLEPLIAASSRTDLQGMTSSDRDRLQGELEDIRTVVFSRPAQAAARTASVIEEFGGEEAPRSIVAVCGIRRAQSLALLGRYHESFAECENAGRVFDVSRGPQLGTATAKIALALAHNEAWRREDAVRIVQETEGLCLEIEHRPDRSYALSATKSLLATLNYSRTQAADIPSIDTTLSVVERDATMENDIWTLAVVNYDRGKVYYHHHRYHESHSFIWRAIELARMSGNLNLEYKARVFLAKIFYKDGDYPTALGLARNCGERFADQQYTRGEIIATALVARVCLALYDYAAAEACVERLEELIFRHFPGMMETFSDIHILRAKIHYRRGRPGPCVQTLQGIPLRSLQRNLSADAERYRRLAQLELGDYPEESLMQPRSLYAHSESVGDDFDNIRGLADFALVLLRSGKWEDCERVIAQSVEAVPKAQAWRGCYGMHLGGMSCRRGVMLLQQGDIAAAISQFDRSLMDYSSTTPVSGALTRHRARSAFMLYVAAVLSERGDEDGRATVCVGLIQELGQPVDQMVSGFLGDLERAAANARWLRMVCAALGRNAAPQAEGAGAIGDYYLAVREASAELAVTLDEFERVGAQVRLVLERPMLGASLDELTQECRASIDVVERVVGRMMLVGEVIRIPGGRFARKSGTIEEAESLVDLFAAENIVHWETLQGVFRARPTEPAG